MSERLSISRRAVLRGLGASVALPLLDIMQARPVRAQVAVARPRLFVMFTPNGVNANAFWPSSTGRDYVLSPTLAPLAAVRDQILVVGNVKNPSANALPHEAGGGHARGTASFLTSSHPEFATVDVGVSMDQVFAREVGADLGLASLQLGCEADQTSGVCDSGFSCAYPDNISWASASTPLPKTISPMAAFDRLFSEGAFDAPPAERAQRKSLDVSILDMVQDDTRWLMGKVGARDRHKLEAYLNAVREIELRAQVSEPLLSSCEVMERPAQTPGSLESYIRLMIDIAILAFQCDLTCAATLMVGRGGSNRSYGFLTGGGGHHEVSHHQQRPEKLAVLAQIDHFHMEQLAYAIQRLADIDQGGRTLLDDTIVLSGSELGDGQSHTNTKLPVILAGGGSRLALGQHIALPNGATMGDVHLTLLRAGGVVRTEFGDDGRTIQSALLGEGTSAG